MELSSELSAEIEHISEYFNDSNYLELLKKLETFISLEEDSHDEKICEIQPLYSILLEAAKHDIEESILSFTLEQLKWPTDRIDNLIDVYKRKKGLLRWKLSQFSTFPSVITDVTWKMDYIVKDSTGTKSGELIYIVKFHVIENNKLEDITFTCSLAELTHLATKLKQACRFVEKYASNSC